MKRIIQLALCVVGVVYLFLTKVSLTYAAPANCPLTVNGFDSRYPIVQSQTLTEFKFDISEITRDFATQIYKFKFSKPAVCGGMTEDSCMAEVDTGLNTASFKRELPWGDVHLGQNIIELFNSPTDILACNPVTFTIIAPTPTPRPVCDIQITPSDVVDFNTQITITVDNLPPLSVGDHIRIRKGSNVVREKRRITMSNSLTWVVDPLGATGDYIVSMELGDGSIPCRKPFYVICPGCPPPTPLPPTSTPVPPPPTPTPPLVCYDYLRRGADPCPREGGACCSLPDCTNHPACIIPPGPPGINAKDICEQIEAGCEAIGKSCDTLPPGSDEQKTCKKREENCRKDVAKCNECFDQRGAWTALGCIKTDVGGFVRDLFRIILGVVGGIAFLLLLKGGFQIMFSRGDAEELADGQQTITAAIAGLIFIFLAIFVLKIIGVDILDLPGFGPD